MYTENSIVIEAPAETVWAVFADVETWHEWTASVERIVPHDDNGEFALGSRYEIRQPRFPALDWEITELEFGRSWTWRTTSIGASTTASHTVDPDGPTRTVVTQTIEQRGAIGTVVAVVARRLTRRYLQLEADGLKARSEAAVGDDAAAR